MRRANAETRMQLAWQATRLGWLDWDAPAAGGAPHFSPDARITVCSIAPPSRSVAGPVARRTRWCRVLRLRWSPARL